MTHSDPSSPNQQLTAPSDSARNTAAERSTAAATESEASPRAFAIGTGYVLQGVGLVMALATCCLWSMSGRVLDKVQEPAQRWADYFTPQHLPATAAMLGVVLSFVSGLALVAVGMGLQGEKRNSGRWAMWTTAFAGLSYLTLVVMLGANGLWIRALVPAALSVVMVVMFLLAGHSAEILRAHPPSEDQSIVTDEWLEQHRLRRARMREGADETHAGDGPTP